VISESFGQVLKKKKPFKKSRKKKGETFRKKKGTHSGENHWEDQVPLCIRKGYSSSSGEKKKKKSTAPLKENEKDRKKKPPPKIIHHEIEGNHLSRRRKAFGGGQGESPNFCAGPRGGKEKDAGVPELGKSGERVKRKNGPLLF